MLISQQQLRTIGASSMAPQEDLAGNNGVQVAQEDVIHGSLVGSHQGEGAGTAMDSFHAGVTATAMAPSDDQDEDNTSFSHDTLLRDLHGPLTEFDDIVDLNFLLGGLIGGGAAVADDVEDAEGTSLVAGEEGDDSNMDGLGNLDGLQIPYDLLQTFVVPCHNNRNNIRRE
jgi:hypothetical protein